MRTRLLKTVMYLLLTLGAVTMVFPFFWMVATSFKSSLEVLSEQISLIPELKKYIRVEGELEQVEFLLALDLESAVSHSEGVINREILGKEYLETHFGSEVLNYFGEYHQGLKEIFLKYLPKSEAERRVIDLGQKTVSRITGLATARNLAPVLSKRLKQELSGLTAAVRNVIAKSVYGQDELEVMVLAGEGRGGKYTIALDDVIQKRFLWSNFQKAWQAAPFGRYFINSIFMSIAVTVGQVLTSALAAYAFARMQFRFKEGLFLILLGTMMVPKQIILIPDFVIISKLGWMNTYYALIVPFIAAVFGIYFMRQHFETLPQDLFDAASIDGCGRFRTLFRIVLPLSRSVIVTVCLFTFIMTWNSLLWPLVMTNTPEMRPLQVGLAVFNQESGTDWELLMAASTFSILPLLLIFFIAQKQFVEGITRSGMKG